MSKLKPQQALNRHIDWFRSSTVNAAVKRGGPNGDLSRFFLLENDEAKMLFNPSYPPIRNPDTIYVNLGISRIGIPKFKPTLAFSKKYPPDHHSRFFNCYDLVPIKKMDLSIYIPSITVGLEADSIGKNIKKWISAIKKLLVGITFIPPGLGKNMIDEWEKKRRKNLNQFFLYPPPNRASGEKKLVEHFFFNDEGNDRESVAGIKTDVGNGSHLVLAMGIWNGQFVTQGNLSQNSINDLKKYDGPIFKPILLTASSKTTFAGLTYEDFKSKLLSSFGLAAENKAWKLLSEALNKLQPNTARTYYDLAKPCPHECDTR